MNVRDRELVQPYGTLRKNLTAQIKRMLADPKSAALVENYAGQWLQIRNIRIVQPDARAFPDWDQALATAMQRETELLFQTIMREDRSVLEIIAADYTFVNERLAKHYGLRGIEGEAFVQVPVYQWARGVQLTADWSAVAGVSFRF